MDWNAPWIECGLSFFYELSLDVKCKGQRWLHFELGGSADGLLIWNGRHLGVVFFIYGLRLDVKEKGQGGFISNSVGVQLGI